MKKIAIIGFGFCGRLSLFHLADRLSEGDKLYIFDKNPLTDLGAAFSQFSPHYILNVPVAKMSAFSYDPDNFKNFLEKFFPEVFAKLGSDGFAPRHLYGNYLQEITVAALHKISRKKIDFQFVEDEVVEVKKGKNFLIVTSNRETCEVDQLLLGSSFSQSNLPYDFEQKNFVKKLWGREALPFHEKKFSDETICLIGSGLTAVDVLVGLKNKGFSGKVIVISRRGNFPKRHFDATDPSSLLRSSEDLLRLVEELKLMDDAGVLAICLKIRKFLRENPQFDLRHVIDSIRPITTKLWQNFDDKNKKLFLRFWTYWNIFRHRAPGLSLDLIAQMNVEVRKKGIKNIMKIGDRFLVDETPCDFVVNCLGFDMKAQNYPLLNQMIGENLLKAEILLVSTNDKNLHLLGGLNIARDFECTAVPDLRISVEETVKMI